MSDNRSEKRLIGKLKQGDREAVNELVARYFDRVVRAAEKRLATRNAGGSDGDDVAASVFESIWRRASEQRFDEGDLESPDEFWRLLCKLIQFKTDDHARRATAQKRGGGAVRGESVFTRPDDASSPGLDGQAGKNLSPSDYLELEEGYARMLNLLDDDTLREISLLRMENHKVTEIADRFGKSDRWVKRKLALIRDIWANEVGEVG